MKDQKEALLVLILKNKKLLYKATIISVCILSVLNFSCSHKFIKLGKTGDGNIIEQELTLKIHNKDKIDKITVYSQIDREKKLAILDGIGKLDTYVFHLEINGEQFYLEDHINKKKQKGSLHEFNIIPLKNIDLFEKIDIKQPQPIILKNEKDEITVEIFVKKQK